MIRIAAGLLASSSLYSFYTDLPAYQSHAAHKQGSADKALFYASEAYERGDRDADFLQLYAELLEKKAAESGSLEDLKRAAAAWEEVSVRFPRYGKALLKKIILEAALMQKDKPLDAVQTSVLEKELFRSLSLQPGSPWMAFHAAETILRISHDRAVKTKAAELLKRAVASDPGRYLGPSLDLERRYFPEGYGKPSLIPNDFEGYFHAARYFQKKGLWGSWRRAYERQREDQFVEYGSLCERAEKSYQDGHIQEALENFQKAVWLDAYPARASAGAALCLYHLRAESFLSVQKRLTQALEEGEPLGDIVHFLNAPDAPAVGNYLKGLLLLEDGRYREAVHSFDKAEATEKYPDFYRAKALFLTGEKAAALAPLNLKFENKTANLRELSLLADENPVSRAAIHLRLKEASSRIRPVRAWWDSVGQRSILQEGQKSGMHLMLLPGKTVVWVALKLREGQGSSAGLLFKLSGRYTAAAEINSKKWKTFKLELDTQGGKYWLEVERLGSEANSMIAPEVELGEVYLQPLYFSARAPGEPRGGGGSEA